MHDGRAFAFTMRKDYYGAFHLGPARSSGGQSKFPMTGVQRRAAGRRMGANSRLGGAARQQECMDLKQYCRDNRYKYPLSCRVALVEWLDRTTAWQERGFSIAGEVFSAGRSRRTDEPGEALALLKQNRSAIETPRGKRAAVLSGAKPPPPSVPPPPK